jgi:hypothetical protein
MNDSLKLKGLVSWEITRADGTIETGERQNTITRTGVDMIVNRMVNGTGMTVNYIGFGTGVAAPATTNTTLTGATYILTTNTVGATAVGVSDNAIAQWGATLTGVALNVGEVGLFYGQGTSMMARQYFSGNQIPLAVADSLKITWQVQFTAG